MARDTAETPMGRTFAQWYCLLAGASLLVAGLLGFIADTGFDTGGKVQGDNLIVFEVNGWHNLVHLGSGLALLAAANYRPTAKTMAYAFGAVYGLVTIIGLIDGNDVLDVFPVNPADNVLHVLLSVAALLCAYVSPTTKGQQRERKTRKRGVKEVDAPVAGGTATGRVKSPVGSPNDAGIPTSGGFGERTTQDRENTR